MPPPQMCAQASVASPSLYPASAVVPSKGGNGSGPAVAFICIGAVLLLMLSAIPVWNALILLQDANYMFWAGAALPRLIIGTCLGVLLLYVMTVAAYFHFSGQQVQTEQTIMMIANLFIMLLGLAMVLVSLPVSRQSVDTYNRLMHRCNFNDQSQFLLEYSQVLHNIRGTPQCAVRHSIEECEGYEAVQPYTTLLKAMESQFHCTSFCHLPVASAFVVTNVRDHDRRERARRRHDAISAAALSADDDVSMMEERSIAKPVPALFSPDAYEASCEGMAARSMKTLAGDIGVQTFYQGIYLMNLAVVMGFLKLLGYCVRRDHTSSMFKAYG